MVSGSRRVGRLKARTKVQSDARAAIATKAVAYVRVSTEEQAATGHGLETQDKAVRAFVDQEISPRFPDGLTVLDGGGQWRGKEDRPIREASKVVMIVLPNGREASDRIEAVREAYKAKFHQESVLLVTAAACVSF